MTHPFLAKPSSFLKNVLFEKLPEAIEIPVWTSIYWALTVKANRQVNKKME
jgi:hypothetical protein